jgi:hypothetical protein
VAHVCASTGWTWDYVLEHVDIPRLETLHKYWADHPPLQWMIASYFGIGDKKTSSQNIEEASEFVPVETVAKAEFDSLLGELGLPVN